MYLFVRFRHNTIYAFIIRHKQGIEDGFLAPYKVIRIDIDKDVKGWTPPPGMTDDLGHDIEDRTYNRKDMDRILKPGTSDSLETYLDFSDPA